MDLEEALKSAMGLEARLARMYRAAARQSRIDVARKIFELLAADERDHLELLEARAAEWAAEGMLTLPAIESPVPSPLEVETLVARLDARIAVAAEEATREVEALEAALELEQQTSDFYERMAARLDGDAQRLFRALLEVEASHLTLLRAQIDAINGYGYWFDPSP